MRSPMRRIVNEHPDAMRMRRLVDFDDRAQFQAFVVGAIRVELMSILYERMALTVELSARNGGYAEN